MLLVFKTINLHNLNHAHQNKKSFASRSPTFTPNRVIVLPWPSSIIALLPDWLRWLLVKSAKFVIPETAPSAILSPDCEMLKSVIVS